MEADKTQKLLKEKLKEKGLKVTHQRLLVLSVLEENSGSHMTAEDIYDLVSEDYPEIGLATVYRTLQLLWDMQLVDRINFGDGCVRYEIGHLLNGETKHNHHHLICKRCNKVMPFDDDLLESLEDNIEKVAYFHYTILAKMDDLRSSVDTAEALIPDSFLPYPTYDELLFSV